MPIDLDFFVLLVVASASLLSLQSSNSQTTTVLRQKVFLDNYVLALMMSTSIHRKAMTHRAPDKECSGWETNYLTVVVFEHVTRTYTYNVDVDVSTGSGHFGR